MAQKPARYELKALLPLAITMLVLGLLYGFSQFVMTDTIEDHCEEEGYIYNITAEGCQDATNESELQTDTHQADAFINGQTALSNITSKFGQVLTVIMAAVIIFIVVRFFKVN